MKKKRHRKGVIAIKIIKKEAMYCMRKGWEE